MPPKVTILPRIGQLAPLIAARHHSSSLVIARHQLRIFCAILALAWFYELLRGSTSFCAVLRAFAQFYELLHTFAHFAHFAHFCALLRAFARFCTLLHCKLSFGENQYCIIVN
jgi:hypothetical protein